ncbi:MAG: hypothetical protein MJ172_09000 [Clostridia bacterium]|nr:hypothetical protein [Clostridia bacterium]
MRKINLLIFNFIVILLLAGCSSEVLETETKDIEETKPEITTETTTEKTEETTSVTTDMDSDIPGEEEVLRFWAENYSYIVDTNVISQNVTEQDIFVNLFDYDSDNMPEMIISYTDSDWKFINIYCDVNSNLDSFYCTPFSDLYGQMLTDLSNHPVVVFENASRNMHYIFPYMTSETDGINNTLISGFYDITFAKGEDMISIPSGLKIKYVEESFDENLFETDKTYYDTFGNTVGEEEYYSEAGIYSYLVNIDGRLAIDGEWVDIPHFGEGCRIYNFTKNEFAVYNTNVNQLYSDMSNSYAETKLEEDMLGDPYFAVEGTWTLSDFDVYGWEEDRDYELIFTDGALTVRENINGEVTEYNDVSYCVEYDYIMDGQEPWSVRIAPVGEFDFLNAKLSTDGKIMYLGVGGGEVGEETEEDYFTGFITLTKN